LAAGGSNTIDRADHPVMMQLELHHDRLFRLSMICTQHFALSRGAGSRFLRIMLCITLCDLADRRHGLAG
jgi:hypothetical protein